MTPDDMNRLRRALEGESDDALEAAMAEHNRRRGDHAMMTIVWTVVVCYLLFLFAYLGYLFAKSILLHADVSGEITEMLKIFLLPVVTLVLGYALGASRR